MPKRKRKLPKKSLHERSRSTPFAVGEDYIHRQHDWEKSFSPSPPHGGKPLPCGHDSHPDALEEMWASPEFAKRTAKQKNRLTQLITAIRGKRALSPGRYPPFPRTSENEREHEVRQYFRTLKRQLGPRLRSEYLAYVDRFEAANHYFLGLRPCRREGKIMPLHPSEIDGLLRPEELTTPRTGGRRPSSTVQERNALIRELRPTNKDREVCRILDDRKVPIDNKSWRRQDITTWRQAFASKKNAVQVLFSRIAPKRKQQARLSKNFP